MAGKKVSMKYKTQRKFLRRKAKQIKDTHEQSEGVRYQSGAFSVSNTPDEICLKRKRKKPTQTTVNITCVKPQVEVVAKRKK